MCLETKTEKKSPSPSGPGITEKAVWSFNLLFTLLMYGKWGEKAREKLGCLKDKGNEKR